MNVTVYDMARYAELYDDEITACEICTDTQVLYEAVFMEDGSVQSAVFSW